MSNKFSNFCKDFLKTFYISFDFALHHLQYVLLFGTSMNIDENNFYLVLVAFSIVFLMNIPSIFSLVEGTTRVLESENIIVKYRKSNEQQFNNFNLDILQENELPNTSSNNQNIPSLSAVKFNSNSNLKDSDRSSLRQNTHDNHMKSSIPSTRNTVQNHKSNRINSMHLDEPSTSKFTTYIARNRRSSNINSMHLDEPSTSKFTTNIARNQRLSNINSVNLDEPSTSGLQTYTARNQRLSNINSVLLPVAYKRIL